MNQHRLVVDTRLIRRDYDSANDPAYSLFYQMTRITKDRGALRHDDRLDAVEGAVRYWVSQVAQDTDRAAHEHNQRLLDMELEKFIEGVFGQREQRDTWIRLP